MQGQGHGPKSGTSAKTGANSDVVTGGIPGARA